MFEYISNTVHFNSAVIHNKSYETEGKVAVSYDFHLVNEKVEIEVIDYEPFDLVLKHQDEIIVENDLDYEVIEENKDSIDLTQFYQLLYEKHNIPLDLRKTVW